MNRSSFGRVVVGVVLFLALGGPSPGAVGACDGEVATIDPEQFCVNRGARQCDRDRARAMGELPPAPAPCPDNPDTPLNEADPATCAWLYCRDQLRTRCSGTTDWSDCAPPPSVATANACLFALESFDRLNEPTGAIPECRPEVICPMAGALREELDETEPEETDLESAPSESAEVP